MKPIIVEPLNIWQCNVCGGNLTCFTCKCAQDIAASVRAGGGKLVFTALVSEESFYFNIETVCGLNIRGNPDLHRAFNSLCEVLRFQGHELPLSVTLKIEPVHGAAKVDAAR
jgi:hypothetical protein